ncbi:MAG TPA: DUF975 family protein [Chitinophagales bacterium]|nr:DUF975 family protein [Chitinophagales bacterium]
MKTENVVLMKMARESLQGKWGLAIGTTVLFILISVAMEIVAKFFPLSILLALIISGPLELGISIFFLALSRNQDARVEHLFKGFDNFFVASGAYILIAVFTLLWSLLLIIPGIIAALSYSMTFYILADDNSIRAMEAIDKSKEMMDGYKLKFFYLNLRFFGWALLCILTLGIGFLWLIPYVQVSVAKFYDDIKGNQMTVENI